jgi:hypothetical protein
MEASTRGSLGCDPESALQLAHVVDGRGPTGGVGSGPAGHALARPCVPDLTTAGALPSRRVVRRDDSRYYDPLGRPLCRARFRRWLIRVALPRPGLRRRASRVPSVSVHACCAPYPAETHCACPGMVRSRHGLHRDMIGSALGLYLCRGCRLHVRLRPACLLPPKRLLTPRSGHRRLRPCLGSATRRSGAYRGGTCTRWR